MLTEAKQISNIYYTSEIQLKFNMTTKQIIQTSNNENFKV